MLTPGKRVMIPSGEVGQLLHRCISTKGGEAWIVLVGKQGVRVKVEDMRTEDKGQ